jgi:hypothetical protein
LVWQYHTGDVVADDGKEARGTRHSRIFGSFYFLTIRAQLPQRKPREVIMRRFVVTLAAATVLVASAPIMGASVGAAAIVAPGAIRAAADSLNLVESVQFIWLGHNYCWYDDGWNGPGWYWCDYGGRVGLGWGGGYGWHNWRGGHPSGGKGGRGGPSDHGGKVDTSGPSGKGGTSSSSGKGGPSGGGSSGKGNKQH